MIRRVITHRLRYLLATGAAATALVAALGSGTAGAGGPHIEQVRDGSGPAPAANVPVTIRYHGADGAVTSTWHGPRAAAEEQVATWRAQRAGSGPGVVRPDIEKPPSCHLPTTYWVFRADSLTCYRYGGTANINIKNVYEVDSGNNAGYYVAGGTRYTVQKYVYDLWDPKVTVTQIHID